MTEIHTDADLLRALQSATTRAPTREQVEAQRLSFVMGVLPEDNDMTREQVREMLDKQDGRSIDLK